MKSDTPPQFRGSWIQPPNDRERGQDEQRDPARPAEPEPRRSLAPLPEEHQEDQPEGVERGEERADDPDRPQPDAAPSGRERRARR